MVPRSCVHTCFNLANQLPAAAMHIALAMVTLESRVSGCNPSMAAVVGCSCEELVDTPFLDCFHPEDASVLAQAMRDLLAVPIAPSTLQAPLWRVLALRVFRKVGVGCALSPACTFSDGHCLPSRIIRLCQRVVVYHLYLARGGNRTAFHCSLMASKSTTALVKLMDMPWSKCLSTSSSY